MKKFWKEKILINLVRLLGRIRIKSREDDKKYLSLLYRVRLGTFPDWKNPKTFNEKMQYLKVYHRHPLQTVMVDKYRVKEYVKKRIGEQYVIPNLGVWDRFEDIDFNRLPDQFVLKCTHDSGGLVIVQDKKKLNISKARKKINHSLHRNYYLNTREWPYRNVKPRIIAEEYLENSKEGLHDYKVWCFNGEPLYVQYISGRQGNVTYEGFYDRDWNLQPFSYHNPRMEKPVPRPECLPEMLRIAAVLAKGEPFLRCDFYILEDGTIRFGELTFFPMSGLETWKPDMQDCVMGEMLKLD